MGCCLGCAKGRRLLASAIRHRGDAGKAQDHHGPGGRFVDCAYGAKQSTGLPVDPVRKKQSIRASSSASIPKGERPKPARGLRPCINRDRAEKSSSDRIEGINLTGRKAEVTDEQVATERAEAR